MLKINRILIMKFIFLSIIVVSSCKSESEIEPCYTDKYEKNNNNYKEEGKIFKKNGSLFVDQYSVTLSEYASLPQKIGLNESFKSDEFPNVKVKLLQIDKEKNKCLVKYEGPSDSNIINPQWYQKNDAIFPSIYGSFGVTIDDIREDETYIVVHWGSIESEKEYQIITLKPNETFRTVRLPTVEIRLIQIDKDKKKCLIRYEGISGGNIDNPQWYQKGEEIFPSIFAEYCVTVHDIQNDRIYVQLNRPRYN